MKPTLGRIVHYKLTAGDVEQINRRREDFHAFNRANRASAASPGYFPGRSGHVGHFGNEVTEGDVYPATVVRIFSPGSTTVNLQVQLDGNDTYWATSRPEGDEPGQWSWPPRVEHEAGDRPARF
jgi:hypothetical protein